MPTAQLRSIPPSHQMATIPRIETGLASFSTSKNAGISHE